MSMPFRSTVAALALAALAAAPALAQGQTGAVRAQHGTELTALGGRAVVPDTHVLFAA